MIKQFAILGERCSGTNFLYGAMIENFKLSFNYNFTNKHFFGFEKYDNSDDTIFIGIVRERNVPNNYS